MRKYYLIKCETIYENTLYFCHQVIYGENQSVFIANINNALFYNENEVKEAEMALQQNIKFSDIKSYRIQDINDLQKNKKGKLMSLQKITKVNL
jgi:hypothetical protein